MTSMTLTRLRARRSVRNLLPTRGDDGLTDRQRRKLNERFESGLGSIPSAEHFARARQAAPTTHHRKYESLAG